MRIAFYSTTFFPYICGVTTAILNLSLGLTKKGHQIVLCIPKAKSPVFEKIKKQGIKIVFLPSFKTKIYKDKDLNVGAPSAKSFLKIKKFDPDIIHFHTPVFAGLEAILTAKILKKPLIGTFHTYFMSPEYQKIVKLGKISEEFIEKILWKYNNSIYNRCDLVISPSEFARRDLINNGLKKPIKIVHNPVDLNVKKKLKLGNKTILYIGRLSREKSLNILILAFNLVVRKIPKAKLLLVGDGPVKEELEELATSLGLEKNIVFTGKIGHHQLLKSGIFERSSLFATASTSEVQPMSTLEAMAFGLPIVGVKARGMPELIRGNGLICKPGDIRNISAAIIKILENKVLRKKFAQKSKELIRRKYSAEKATTKLERIYTNLAT